MTAKPLKLLPARRGRPQKFGRASRAITVTLPEDVITALADLDRDLSRAVVRLAQPLTEHFPHPAAELKNYGDSAVIIVKPSAALRRIAGVTLVPLPDGRALISLEEDMPVHELELKIRDIIEDPKPVDPQERAALMAISQILKSARQTRGMAVHQRSIIVLQSTRRRRISE
jgi:hypothetical protein